MFAKIFISCLLLHETYFTGKANDTRYKITWVKYLIMFDALSK